MGEPATRVRHGYAEHVALEAASTIKHEYREGEILALAGRTLSSQRPSSAISAGSFGAARVASSPLTSE